MNPRVPHPRAPGQYGPRSDLRRRLDELAPITFVQTSVGALAPAELGAWVDEQRRAGGRVAWLQAAAYLNHSEAFVPAMHGCMARAGAFDDPPAGSWSVLVIEHLDQLTRPSVLDIPVRLAARVPDFHVVACGSTGDLLRAAAERRGVPLSAVRGVAGAADASAAERSGRPDGLHRR